MSKINGDCEGYRPTDLENDMYEHQDGNQQVSKIRDIMFVYIDIPNKQAQIP